MVVGMYAKPYLVRHDCQVDPKAETKEGLTTLFDLERVYEVVWMWYDIVHTTYMIVTVPRKRSRNENIHIYIFKLLITNLGERALKRLTRFSSSSIGPTPSGIRKQSNFFYPNTAAYTATTTAAKAAYLVPVVAIVHPETELPLLDAASSVDDGTEAGAVCAVVVGIERVGARVGGSEGGSQPQVQVLYARLQVFLQSVVAAKQLQTHWKDPMSTQSSPQFS